MAEGPLGGVVGGLDVLDLGECPEHFVLLEQPGAESCGLWVVSALALLEQGADALAKRGERGGQPSEIVVMLEIGAVGADHLARRGHEPLSELAGGTLALGDLAICLIACDQHSCCWSTSRKW